MFLRNEMKESAREVDLTKRKFMWGNVLVGLALLHDHKQGLTRESSVSDEDGPSIYDSIDRTTRALGPFLVPMIDYLGTLSADEESGHGQKGDDD